jgi:hypothetical protein
VDFGDRLVGEAEHLAQDFVGMLAQQRRAQLQELPHRRKAGIRLNKGRTCHFQAPFVTRSKI